MVRIVDLGRINLGSKVIMTDPCYELGTWCTETIENMRAGEYVACAAVCEEESDDWCAGRIMAQYVLPEGMTIEEFKGRSQKFTDIGVDSATAGIFDYDFFKEAKKKDDTLYMQEHFFNVQHESSSIWTLGTPCGRGIVTTSGVGDGSYPVSFVLEDGEVIALGITFIEEEEEDVSSYMTGDYVLKESDANNLLDLARGVIKSYQDAQDAVSLAEVADKAVDLCDLIVDLLEKE